MRGKLTRKLCRSAEDAIFGSEKEAISDPLMVLVWLKERFLSGLLGDTPESWAYRVRDHDLQMACKRHGSPTRQFLTQTHAYLIDLTQLLQTPFAAEQHSKLCCFCFQVADKGSSKSSC